MIYSNINKLFLIFYIVLNFQCLAVEVKKEIKAENDYMYQIKKGDTLFSIAQLCVIKTQSLLDYNQIKSVNLIKIGSTIKIPKNIALKCKEKLEDPKRIKALELNAQNNLTKNEEQNKNLKTEPKKIVNVEIEKQIVSTKEENRKKIVPKRINNNCLICNLKKPMKGIIQDTFGKDGTKYSTGILIKTNQNKEPVRSVKDGKIIYSGDNISISGEQLIVISHGNFFSAYSFIPNGEIMIKEKDRVKEGQILGYINYSDKSDFQLYFSVRALNGMICNPLDLLNNKEEF